MSKLVLIIDDDAELRQSMKVGLEKAEWVVATAESAEEGREVLARLAPDAIVLDRMMGGMDGLTFLGEIRDGGNLTPVIMLTAMDGAENTIEGLSAKANDYMAKPFSMRELILRLGNVTNQGAARVEPRKMPIGLLAEDGEFYAYGNLLPLSTHEKNALSEMLSGAIHETQAMTIKRLRTKLALANLSSVDIIAVRGKGYKLVVRA